MGYISSATPMAARSLGTTISTLAPCCKIWFYVTRTPGRCWWFGLGCENNQVEAFRETLGEFDPQRVHFMVCQHQDDEVEAGVEHLHQLYEVMRQDKRQPGKLSELKFGLECGGSDGLSGITANPMLGRFSDYVDRQRRHYRADRSAGDVRR